MFAPSPADHPGQFTGGVVENFLGGEATGTAESEKADAKSGGHGSVRL